MIEELTDEVLARRVRWMTNVVDERHMEWCPGQGAALERVASEEIDGGCWLVSFEDDETSAPLTVAKLGDEWYSLGPWEGPGGCKEARRCGFVKGAAGVPPTPLWKVGEILYRASVGTVEDRVECVDCSGTGVWVATSATGEEFPLRCPRCDGRKVLVKRVPGAVGDMFHIRSIEAKTCAGWSGSAVTYYESAGCCGGTAPEWALFPTEAEALAFAEIRARKDRAKHEERLVEKGVKDLRLHTVTNAKIEEAESQLSRVEYDRRYLRERVMELLKEDTGLYVFGEIADDDAYGGRNGIELTLEQRETVVGWIMSDNEGDTTFWQEWRTNDENS